MAANFPFAAVAVAIPLALMRGRRNWSQLLDYDNYYCLGEDAFEAQSSINTAPFRVAVMSVAHKQMGLERRSWPRPHTGL